MVRVRVRIRVRVRVRVRVRARARTRVRVRVRGLELGLDYRTLGLSNPRINEPSDCRPVTFRFTPGRSNVPALPKFVDSQVFQCSDCYSSNSVE